MHKYCCLRVAIHTTERELELEVDSVFDRETLKTREGTKKVSHQMKWNLLIRRWFIARITFSSLPMHLGDCLNGGMCWMENDGAGKIWGSHLKVWKSHLKGLKSHRFLQSRTSFAQNRTSNHKSRTFQYGSQIKKPNSRANLQTSRAVHPNSRIHLKTRTTQYKIHNSL